MATDGEAHCVCGRYGVRVLEEQLLADPPAAVARAMLPHANTHPPILHPSPATAHEAAPAEGGHQPPTGGRRAQGADGAVSERAWAQLRRGLLRARRRLAYRTPGSLVASLALREAWESCVHTTGSAARPPATVAKC
jgi:hypothetical protein